MQAKISHHYHKRAIKTLSFLLVFLFVLSGCSKTNETTYHSPTQYVPKSQQVIIKPLSDQIIDWKEGQFYPGAFHKDTTTFQFPTEPTAFVSEANGILYAFGTERDIEGTKRTYVVRKYYGIQKEAIFLPEIPEDYGLHGVYIGTDTIFLLANPYEMASDTENSHLELFLYSLSGELRKRVKLADLLEESKVLDYSITGFTDKEGTLWVRVPEEGKLYRISPAGQLSQSITIPMDFQGGFMRGKETDELLAVLGTGNGLMFGKMNTKTKASENYVIEGLPGVRNVFPGTKYDALVMTEKSLYGVILGEETVLKELLAFTDLGIDVTILRSIQEHEEGRLSMILYERTKTEGEQVYLIPKTTKVREGLTLACLKTNEYLNYAVNQYNDKNPDDKIILKEYYDKYAVDASEESALNRLNSDLMDGTAGDIICLEGLNFSGATITYLDKGIFLDLYELMNNDPEFQREDFFTDVWRANEIDGKLYRLVPFFSLNTKYGRMDDVGESYQINESLLFETESVENLFGPMYRRTEFIHDLLVFSLGDPEDSNAVFYDSGKMIKYIEIMKNLPDFETYSGEGEVSAGYIEASYRKWKDLRDHVNRFYFSEYHSEDAYFRALRKASVYLDQPSLFPIPDEIDSIEYRHNIGVQVTFSGFPVKEGCGTALINCLPLAVSSATEVRDEAWGFLKYLLSEEYQSVRKLCSNAIPVRKDVFNHNVERLMAYQDENDDPAYLQGGGGQVSETGEDITYWTPVTQQWMVDAFLGLLPNITKLDEVDPYVEAILTEEIGKYCDDRQTAEEAAINIKERIKLYVDER